MAMQKQIEAAAMSLMKTVDKCAWDRAEAALAAAETAAWEPIETAPKDGTRFLAYASDDEIGIVSILHRHDPGGIARNPRYNFECWVTDFNSPNGPPPIKWRPLPPPSSATGAG